MSALTRRDAIAAGTDVVAGGFAGVAAAVEPTHADPALEAIETRMTAVENRGTTLNPRQKYAVLLAVVTAVGTPAPVARLVKAALKAEVTPVEVKEILYQCAPYTGFGRVDNVLTEANRAMQEAGVKLPLPDQTQVTDENRLAKGIEVQTAIFGDVITKMHAGIAENEKALMIRDLSGFCFGDFYTRSGLSIADRELVTFSAIAGLGGCEPQLKAHTAACAKEGLTRQNLIDALEIAVPFLGFPRTLNALAVVKDIIKA